MVIHTNVVGNLKCHIYNKISNGEGIYSFFTDCGDGVYIVYDSHIFFENSYRVSQPYSQKKSNFFVYSSHLFWDASKAPVKRIHFFPPSPKLRTLHQNPQKCLVFWDKQQSKTINNTRYLDRSPVFLTSDDFIRSNKIIRTKSPIYEVISHFVLIISSEHKNSRWSV